MWKDHEIVQIGTLVNGSYNVRLNPNSLVDRIRISFFGETAYADAVGPGIYVYSNLVNDIIGTIGLNYAYDTVAPSSLYSDTVMPKNGMEFFFQTKMSLNGVYRLDFKLFDGSTLPSVTEIFMLIEYFYD